DGGAGAVPVRRPAGPEHRHGPELGAGVPAVPEQPGDLHRRDFVADPVAGVPADLQPAARPGRSADRGVRGNEPGVLTARRWERYSAREPPKTGRPRDQNWYNRGEL